MFISNLPRQLDQYGLQGIFQKAGRVCDVYISESKRKGVSGRYGFVRFSRVEEALRSIKLFHGMFIRGHKLHVAKARPKSRHKQPYSSKSKSRLSSAPKLNPSLRFVRRNTAFGKLKRKMVRKPKNEEQLNKATLVHFSQEDQPLKLSLVGQTNEENEKWLRRSLVCTSPEPRDLATLSSAVIHGYDPNIKLRALSSLKYLLTFPSEDQMHAALSQQDELHQWFTELKAWGPEDYCDSRKVWIVILGVPPHGWCWENFKTIAELWGNFICLGKSVSQIDSFESMKVLIATKILQKIDSEILLQIGSCGYRIKISEYEMVSQPNASNQNHPNSFQSKDKEVIPGFEDVEDSDEVEFSSAAQGQEEEEADNGQANSNSNTVKDVEPTNSNDISRTRTKTASFSQNGYSEEICKVNLHLRALGDAVSNDEVSQVSQPPPGFEKYCIDHSTGVSTPNNYKEALLQGISSPASPTSTLESLVKVAQDSLKIGELLGVKVIENLDAAISRITEPLKKTRAKAKDSAKKRSAQ